MANISTEYYSRFAVGPNVTPILLLQPQLHDMQPSLLKQEAINSNHLYQTTLSSDDPIEYSFAFSSAPSAIDMTSVCSTNPSRFMLDLDQNIHMLSQSQVQSSNNSMPDFDLFPNLVQSVSSSSPFQFDPSIQPNAFPTYSRVHDDGSFETMKLPLDATTPSLSSSSDTSSPSVSSSASSSPVPNDYEEAMATVIPVIACANCKRSHIKCDSGRPCQNCLKHPNKALTCRDAIPKPRGRPKGGSKAAAEAILQARLKQQQQQQQQQLRDQYQGHISRPRVGIEGPLFLHGITTHTL
ncbi:hypothetical protein BGX21_009223 [Mortierella sp. AD011]|nr:hypothetical protein BGX21_009223 [Mortierella sp. AD011]